MGFRLQRRVKLLPGVHVNFSKSGCSLSVGPRGFKTTIGGTRGARASVGIPGTGIRYEMPLGGSRNGGRATYATAGHGVKMQGINPIIHETPEMRKIAVTFLAILKGITIFRILYILGGVLVFFYMCRHGGAFWWFFVWLGVVVIVDCLFTMLVKQQAREAVLKQMGIEEGARRKAQEIHNRAEQAEQQKEARAWADRCQEEQGLITIPSTFPCKRGEGVLYTEYGILLQEIRKVREPGGGSSEQWTTLDSGTLHVTNQRIVFVGDNGARNINIKDILDKKCDVNSIKLTLVNRAKPISFFGGNPTLIVTMIIAIQDYPDLPLVAAE